MKGLWKQLLPPAALYLVFAAVWALLLPWALPAPPAPLPPAGTLPVDRYLALGPEKAEPAGGLMDPARCPAQGRARTPEPVALPILMYHDISDTGEGGSTVAWTTLRDHLLALRREGYHTVSLSQVADFVLWGTPLPDKPVLLTFDDGYLSNHQRLFPLLDGLGMKAAIFPIGVHVGRTEYKDTLSSITPHFSYAQGAEMVRSGTVELGSHTYDMHRYAPLEPEGQARDGVLPLPGEGRLRYCQRLESDFRLSARMLERYAGASPIALAYPQGLHTPESEGARKQAGYLISLTVEPEVSVLRPGCAESLSLLGRFAVDDIPADRLLETIEKGLEKAEGVTPGP